MESIKSQQNLFIQACSSVVKKHKSSLSIIKYWSYKLSQPSQGSPDISGLVKNGRNDTDTNTSIPDYVK